MQRGFHEAAIYFGKVKYASRKEEAVGQPSWESSLLDNPDAKFFCENGGRAHKKKKRTKKKETEACEN